MVHAHSRQGKRDFGLQLSRTTITNGGRKSFEGVAMVLVVIKLKIGGQ